jgi:CRP-like cAMP-binding protein
MKKMGGKMDGNTLDRFEFFEGLQPADRDAIAGMAEVREYAPDTFIFQNGEPADAIHGLLEGAVELSLLFRDRVLKTDEVKYEEAIRSRFEDKDTPIILDEIHAGEVFGWSALAGLEKRTAAARAASAVRAFAIPAGELRKRFAEHPALGLTLTERLNRVIAARLAERTERLVEAWTEAFGAGRI